MSRADATTLSIVSVDLSTLGTLQAPTYRVVERQQWTGLNHLSLFGQIKALGERWRPRHIVIDATGVGEGLWAMLDKAFPTRVLPVKFSAEKKSEIGYRFLSIVETGRFRDETPGGSSPGSDEPDRREAIQGLPGGGAARPAQDDALGRAGRRPRRERGADP